MEERSLTKMETGDMKRNKKKMDERRDLASLKNRKYLFGISDQPFSSLGEVSVVSEEKCVGLFS